MRAKSICARLLPSRSRAHVAPDQGYEPLPAHRIRIGVKGAIVAGTSLRRQGPCCTQQCASNGRSFTPRSEEHTSELQSLMRISYAVFCLKKKKKTQQHDRYKE